MKINFNEQNAELTITLELEKVLPRWSPKYWLMIANIVWALIRKKIGA